MIVDASHHAWVRPTLRVHLALSVGMTVTGVILTAAGLMGGRAAHDIARPAAAPVSTLAARQLTIPVSERLMSALGAHPASPAAAKPRPKPKSKPHPKSTPGSTTTPQHPAPAAPPKTPPRVTPPPPSPAPAPPAAPPLPVHHPPKR